jgi:hypothetical protein
MISKVLEGYRHSKNETIKQPTILAKLLKEIIIPNYDVHRKCRQ